MKRIVFIFVSLFLAQAAFSQGAYKVEKDIPYHAGAGEYAAERCMLDFYYPVDVKDFPTVVWFHGGGLDHGSK